jgi:diguanylate cyclase (GGDEF)-like protein
MEISSELYDLEIKIIQNVINQQQNIIFVADKSQIFISNQKFNDFFDAKHLYEFHDKFTNIENTFVAHQTFFTKDETSDDWISDIEKLYVTNRIISIVDRKDFEPKVFLVKLNKIFSDETKYIITFEDISDTKLESSHKYFNITHDCLTKIYNKSFFMDSLNLSLNQTKRYSSVFSLIMLNIDNLTDTNDKFGFLKGDEIISAIAKNIKKNIRTCDIFAKFNDETFAILLPETNMTKAELLAENLRKLIMSIKVEDVAQITASFGITQFDPIDNSNTIIFRVQEALRIAKKNGKNIIVTQ